MADFIEPKMHPQEEERLRDLLCLGIIPNERERKLDVITELAKEIFSVSISLITLVDKDKQYFKSICGTSLH